MIGTSYVLILRQLDPEPDQQALIDLYRLRPGEHPVERQRRLIKTRVRRWRERNRAAASAYDAFR